MIFFKIFNELLLPLALKQVQLPTLKKPLFFILLTIKMYLISIPLNATIETYLKLNLVDRQQGKYLLSLNPT